MRYGEGIVQTTNFVLGAKAAKAADGTKIRVPFGSEGSNPSARTKHRPMLSLPVAPGIPVVASIKIQQRGVAGKAHEGNAFRISVQYRPGA